MWEDFGNTGPSVVLFLGLIVILLFRQCIMPAVQDTEAGNSNRSEGSLTSGCHCQQQPTDQVALRGDLAALPAWEDRCSSSSSSFAPINIAAADLKFGPKSTATKITTTTNPTGGAALLSTGRSGSRVHDIPGCHFDASR